MGPSYSMAPTIRLPGGAGVDATRIGVRADAGPPTILWRAYHSIGDSIRNIHNRHRGGWPYR